MKCLQTVVICGAALALAACGTKPVPRTAEAKTERNPMEITPNRELQEQLRVGSPEWSQVSSRLRVAGRVEADGTRLARVSSPVTGRLVDVKAIEGQHVTAGQVLATVYSTELSSAQSEFLKAYSQQQVIDRAVARARQLLEAGVIGSAELQKREAELAQATADVAATRERLSVLGLPDDSIGKLQSSRAVNSVTYIVATIDGIVLERKATSGQMVQAVDPIFVIADLSRVWLVADVPEQSAGDIVVGKAVEAEIPALHNRKITGTLSFVSATVNPDTRTVGTRMDVPNPGRLIKPAMLTTMTLIDGASRKLVVPSSAVVREGNQDCVFVEKARNTYVLRPVTLGEDAGEKRVINEGLTGNERIVLDGAFHLNNERKRQELGGEEGD